MVLDVIILVLISMTLGSFGQVYMKLGLRQIGSLDFKDFLTQKFITLITNRYVLLGIGLYGIAVLLWFVVLSKSELSYAYPLIGLSYAVTAVLATFYFNETISLVRWAGILVIILGAFLVIRS